MRNEDADNRKDAASPTTAATRPVLGLIHRADDSPGSFAGIFQDHGYSLELACLPANDAPKRPLRDYAALVVFGGSPQVDQEDIHPWLVDEKQLVRAALEAEMPLLGVCLGAQLLAEASGGWVGPASVARRGVGDVGLSVEALDDPIFSGLPRTFKTIVWHRYEFRLPPDSTPLGRSTTALQAFRINDKRAWAVQFHPEVTPNEMKNWVGWLREAEPDVREEDLDRYYGELSLNIEEQLKLAKQICGGFIAVGIEGHSGPYLA